MYINGGKRIDSKSNTDAPELSPEVATLLIKTHNDYIMQQSAYRMGVGKAFDEAVKQYVLTQLTYKMYLVTNDIISLYTNLGPGLKNHKGTRTEAGSTMDDRKNGVTRTPTWIMDRIWMTGKFYSQDKKRTLVPKFYEKVFIPVPLSLIHI